MFFMLTLLLLQSIHIEETLSKKKGLGGFYGSVRWQPTYTLQSSVVLQVKILL